jgi:hypothetical protein
MKDRKLRFTEIWGSFLLSLFLISSPVWSQQTASIVGTVKDQSGGFVPGVSVRATNIATGYAADALTTDVGSSRFILLPVGEYRIEAELSGFKRFVQEGIRLQVNDRATLDILLQVGEVTDLVTVTGAPPVLEAQTSTLRGTVDRERMVALPLQTRNMTDLVALQSGAVKVTDAGSEGVAYSISGARRGGVFYTLDGGYNTNSYRNYSGRFPNPDVVQEFSVQVNNFSAEYANATGGVVNVITRSGTNDWHGAAFWYARNASFNARNFFASTRDSLKRNQGGATLGGPIVKDKLFVFGSYQTTMLRSDPGLSRQFLPTAAQRQGDFSSLTRTIRDPLTGQPFPGNQIPTSRLNPVALNFLKHIPVPAATNGERFFGLPTVTDIHEWTGKVDYVAARHRISGSMFWYDESRAFQFDPNDIAAGLVTNGNNPYRHITGTHQFTASPSLVSETTVAYRDRNVANLFDEATPINYQNAGVQNIAIKDPPNINFSVSNYFSVSTSWQYELDDDDLNFSNKISWIRGDHHLKFGGETIRSSNIINNHFRTQGIFSFNGYSTGDSLADFMLGNAYSFLQGGGEYKDLTGWRLGLFVNDDWRLNSRVALNLGLRWDPTIPFTDSLGRVQCVRPGSKSARFDNAPEGYVLGGDPGCPEGGFNAYYKSFSPRTGLAWRLPDGKTVVRGGVGLFWYPLHTHQYNRFVNGAPFSPQEERYAVKFEDPYAGTVNPFPEFYAPFEPPRDVAFYPPLGVVGTFAEDFVPAYMWGYNLTLEREVLKDTVVRTSYVGNLGRQLAYPTNINYARYVPGASTVGNVQSRRPMQQFVQVYEVTSDSNSSYHGLNLTLDRRFSALAIKGDYTWSKAIDDSSVDPAPGAESVSDPTSKAANRGVSDHDRTHRFVASYVWGLPDLNASGGFVRALLGGWETSGVFTYQSGGPFSVSSGRDNALAGMGSNKADLISDPELDYGRSRSELIAEYFKKTAFAQNPEGTFGNSGRNLLRGPGYSAWDMALMKKFHITEEVRFQFRWEMFNTLNWVNLNNPTTTLTSGNYAKITGAGAPRIMQFALRLEY